MRRFWQEGSMSRPSIRLPLLIAIVAIASAAEAAVTVTFTQPDKYADVGRNRNDAADVFKEVERHLQRLGETYLAPAQTLKIDVLDIDLAGQEEPSRSGSEIRVLTGRADGPSLRIRYVVESAGRAGESREETLSDMNYLMRPIRQPERLAYEKRMLEEWFRSRFVQRGK
jgi:DUF3016 family protein